MNEIKLNFVDNPDCQETFIDSVRITEVRDQVIRIELCVTRPNALIDGKTLSCTQSPAVRLVMPIPAAITLEATIKHHLSELEKQGVLKAMPTSDAGKPAH